LNVLWDSYDGLRSWR